jgi:hypothetical protein
MATQPLCPLVLSLLAIGPRHTHEVARALASDYPFARVSLERLRAAGLVRLRAGAVYAITRRGGSELALQRGLWALCAGVGGAADQGDEGTGAGAAATDCGRKVSSCDTYRPPCWARGLLATLPSTVARDRRPPYPLWSANAPRTRRGGASVRATLPHCPSPRSAVAARGVHLGDVARMRLKAKLVRSSTVPGASTRTRVQSPGPCDTHPRPVVIRQ